MGLKSAGLMFKGKDFFIFCTQEKRDMLKGPCELCLGVCMAWFESD